MKTSNPLVFVDCETTSLSLETGEIWEFAAIKRMPDGKESDLSLFIEVDLEYADPFALKIGGFHDRYPYKSMTVDKYNAAEAIRLFTHEATLVGNVVSFDAYRLEKLLRQHNECPTWHYHLIDVEVLLAGMLTAQGHDIEIPYKSDEIGKLAKVVPPTEEERHTAMGDAKWAMRMYDACVQETQPPMPQTLAKGGAVTASKFGTEKTYPLEQS